MHKPNKIFVKVAQIDQSPLLEDGSSYTIEFYEFTTPAFRAETYPKYWYSAEYA